MASFFDTLVESATVDLEKDLQDKFSNGGGYIKESGVYKGIIEKAFAFVSTKGSVGIKLFFKSEDNAKMEYDVYVSNAEGKTYFMNSSGTEQSLPEYSKMKRLHYLLSGQKITKFNEIKTEMMLVKVTEWKDGSSSEIQKEVPVLTQWTNKPITIAVQLEETKSIKDPSKTFTNPVVIGYFDAETEQSATEKMKDEEAKSIASAREVINKTPIKQAKVAKTSTGVNNSASATASKPALKIFG